MHFGDPGRKNHVTWNEQTARNNEAQLGKVLVSTRANTISRTLYNVRVSNRDLWIALQVFKPKSCTYHTNLKPKVY